MILLTFVTDSHLALLERYFLPSVFRYPQGIDELRVFRMEQRLPVPEFGTEAYWQHSRAQAVLTARALREAPEGAWVISADCDIQWFGPLTSILEQHPDLDLMCQYDPPDILCGGFMRFRRNAKTVELCDAIARNMETSRSGHATNRLNWDSASLNIPRKGFDLDQVWSQRYVWKTGDPLPIVPPTVLVHHASWIVDLKSKLAMLEHVRSIRQTPQP